MGGYAGPMSGGPPLPDDKPDMGAEGQQQQPSPMPSFMMSSQGADQRNQDQQKQQSQGLAKEAMNLAIQKLLEFRNVSGDLLTAIKAVDPETVALFGPIIEAGKAIESRLQAAVQRAGANQPSMAGMGGPQPPQGGQAPQMGQSAAGM